MENIIDKARKYAVNLHKSVNHYYDGKNYSVHLSMVYNYGLMFEYLIGDINTEEVLASTWTHDLIEDCRVTYNDIKKELGTNIAEITYALTNEKGRNRKERANTKYYDGILTISGARFVKICDRLSNIDYSKTFGSRMFEVYKKEYSDFHIKLYHEDYHDMFEEMKRLLEL